MASVTADLKNMDVDELLALRGDVEKAVDGAGVGTWSGRSRFSVGERSSDAVDRPAARGEQAR